MSIKSLAQVIASISVLFVVGLFLRHLHVIDRESRRASSAPDVSSSYAEIREEAASLRAAALVERAAKEHETTQLDTCLQLLEAASDGREFWVQRARVAEKQLADAAECRATLKPAGVKR